MSDSPSPDFSRFVPGFDFLKSLTQGALKAGPQSGTPPHGMSSWVAPTLNVEDLEKRIEELKAVQFWLDQNAVALKATIQALEVQKMTLATLKGMNFNMADLAQAFQPKVGTPVAAPAQTGAPAEAAAPAQEASSGAASGVADPLQWWSALTQQFQHIAATALKEVASQAAEAAPASVKAPAQKSSPVAAKKGRTTVAAKKRVAAKRPTGKKAAG